jgi:ring-1,2-phenylacetyl-CoA epoxidase subunit PaaE
MDVDMVRQILADKVPNYDAVEVFVCGPGPMMDNVVSVMHEKGLADNHIHREYFTIDKHKTEMSQISDQAEAAATEEVRTRRVKIRLYGSEHEFDVEPDETILSAAQRADLDPPYACQIGACCTCRAKIVTGKVKMDEREALSDAEIAEGYALTCQSHPMTDGVFADYDQ